MAIVASILIGLITLGFILKLTFLSKRAGGTWVLLCTFFTGCCHWWTIEISREQLDGWLQDHLLMQDLAVCIVLDVFLQLSFCLLAAHLQYSRGVSRKWVGLYRLLRLFPGIQIFFLLFFLQVELMGRLTGQSFTGVAWIQAVVFMVLAVFLRSVFLRLLPEKDRRLELLFLLNMLTGLLGLCTTVCGKYPL